MQKQILHEIKELRSLISKLIGTSDLPTEEQFSTTALNKAAKDYKNLSIKRGEWVPESDMDKYFKGAGYSGTGIFIRNEFGFSNYFKHGKTHYYNRKDLLALARELKERNVNLTRYIELKQSQDAFKKRLSAAATNKKATKKKKSYELPDGLWEINTFMLTPPVELVHDDIKKLQEEFIEFKLNKYIDVYKTFAMPSYKYPMSRYVDNELKQRCKRWCESFNCANNALELLTKKKMEFIPVKEADKIQQDL